MLIKFADELKSARLKKGISLEQMAAKTRIDIKFLEAIDNGNFGFLPELYVKAFIKQYAKVVELDEDEVIKRYDDAKAGKLDEKDMSTTKPDEEPKVEEQKTEEKSPEVKKEISLPAVENKEEQTKATQAQTPKKNLRPLAYAAGIIIVVVIILFAFLNKSSKIVVEEKPYDKVLEETKDRYAIPGNKEEPGKQTSTLDTLVLQIANVDSVDSAWVMIIFDDKMKEDFLLYPKRSKTVEALDNFKFTLGNSGVISLILNNHKLNFDGRRGAVRHYMVSKDTIERLTSPPILHTN
jgi:transcriptional regulator with XRE-family HTH domain